MLAIVVESGKAEVREVPQPKPAKGEALIKVRLAGICATDLEVLRGYNGFNGILGHEFVGTIVGGSTALAGKRVVGEINCVCGRCDMCAGGLSSHCRKRTVLGLAGRPGVFAEYVTLPERNCLEVPAGVTDEDAVFTEPLAAAYQVIRQVKIEPRMSVVVLGTGRLGLLVAQVLALTGCRLIAVGRNPKTLGLLDRRRIRTATLDETPQNQDHDVIVDCTGSPEGLRIALGLVRPRGTIVMKTTSAAKGDVDLTSAVVNEVTILGSRCGPFGEALNSLARKQIEVGSMITQVLPLAHGLKALQLAAEPDQIKVLLKVNE
jgi:threonine dehydrogenase-like Zn-dependent dehydrogenase